MDNVEAELKDHFGIGANIELVDAGDRRVQKGEFVFEHETIKLIKVDQKINRKECEMVNLNVETYIGKLKINLKMICFDGWNKSGLMCQLRKMLGLKHGYFDFYTRNEICTFRSIFYYKTFESIKAFYRMNNNMNLSSRCINNENPVRMNLRQFRLREIEGYTMITVKRNLEIGQLAKILIYSRKIDYLTLGNSYVLEDDRTKISELREGSEFICYNRLNGGNPKNYGVSSDEETEEEEDEEEDEEGSENVEEGLIKIEIPKDFEEYDPREEDYVIEPENWAGWANYDEEELKFRYEYDEEDNNRELKLARKQVKEKLKRWKSRENLDKKDPYYLAIVDDVTRYHLERTFLWANGLVCKLDKWWRVASECRGIIYDIGREIKKEFA
jgi:hypothetical protein